MPPPHQQQPSLVTGASTFLSMKYESDELYAQPIPKPPSLARLGPPSSPPADATVDETPRHYASADVQGESKAQKMKKNGVISTVS